MKPNYITTIGGIADVYDGPHATPKKLEKGPYFLSISSLEKGRLDLNKSAFLSEADFKKWTKRVTPKEGDLLFSYETRLGEAALMPSGIRACLGRRMGLLRLNREKVTPEYVLYAYLSPAFQQTIKANTITGATVDRIALNELPSFPIRIPPIEEQKKVAKLLSEIDKKIELNNRINAELEAMAKTLYDYWFVQFDFPDDSPQGQGKPYKTSGGKMVYNPTLKREIPEGWEVKTFGDYSKVKSGFAFKSSWWQEKGIPVLKIKDIQENNSLDQNNLSFVSAEKIDVARKFICKKHDVVIAMTGATIGKFAVIPHMEKPLLVNQRVGLYDLGSEPINRLPFLLNSMKQPIFREKIFQLAGGAAQPNISGDQLDKIPLIHPPHFIVDDFNSKLSYQYSMYCNLESENQKLIELRDWLLPMLMNGQVTVGEAS